MTDVSILIATLNGVKTIRKSIESAQKQTMRDIEIVVVDDGSTDGTYDLVTSMAAADPRIKCIRLPQNVGVGGARNVALANATGTWLTILDADDWYEPNRLEVLLKVAKDEKADLVADNLRIYDHVRGAIVYQTDHGQKNRSFVLTAKDFFDGDNPLRRHPMGFIQPLFRRQFILDNGIVYDQTHRVGEDFLFVAEILLRGGRAFIVPGAYYVYVHRISPTTRKISPHSHSKATSVFSLMVRGCNELLQKFGPTMNADTSLALLRRRWIFERAVMYQDMREAVRQGKILKAARIIAAQPIILVMIGNIVFGLLAANAQAFLHLPSTRSRKLIA